MKVKSMQQRAKRLQQRFSHFGFWYREHFKWLNLGVYGVVLTLILGLLIGTRFSNAVTGVTPVKLNHYASFQNGSGQMKVTSVQYNAAKQFMVLRFETQAGSGTSSDNGLSTKHLDWQFQVLNGPLAKAEVIPTTSDKVVVAVRHLPKQFKAMRITVTNNNVPVNLAADTNSSSSKTQKNAQKQLQFNVLPKQVKTEHGLKYEGRKAYAIGVVGDEIKQQQGYIAQNQQKIKDANQAINTAKDNLKQNQADNQYNTAGEKKQNEQTVATYESQIKSQTATVKTQQGKIKSHQTKIKLLQQEQRDIQSGAYKLQGSVEFSRFK